MATELPDCSRNKSSTLSVGPPRGEQLALPIDGWSAPAIAEIILCSSCGGAIVAMDRRGRSEYRDREGRCFSCASRARAAKGARA
jgi:hypothetical protein